MSFPRLAAALLASSLLSGCTALGGAYVPSGEVSAIAAMDRAAPARMTVDAPAPLPPAARAGLGKQVLARYAADAIAGSPVTRAAFFGIAAGGAAADRARAMRGPSFGLDGHWGAYDDAGQEPLRTDHAFGATGSLTLFDGGAGRLRQEREEWLVASAAADASDKTEAVAYAVAEAYVSVLRARSALSLSAAEAARFVSLLREVRALHAAGATGASDVPEAEARLDRIRQQTTAAQQTLSDAEARFIRITGEQPDFPAPATLPGASGGSGLPELLAGAGKHPAVRAYDARVRAAVKQALAVDAERFGSLVAQFGPSGLVQVFGGANVGAIGSAFLHLTLPVFDSGERAARLRQAAAELEVTMAQRQDVLRSVRMAIRQAWNAETAARSDLRLARMEQQADARLAKAKNADYKAGLTDLRSVLDAEQGSLEAAIRADSARWGLDLAAYKLSAAAGQLAETLHAVGRREIILTDPDPFPMAGLLRKPGKRGGCSWDGNDSQCDWHAWKSSRAMDRPRSRSGSGGRGPGA